MPNSQCPIPNAQCPIPNAQCPMPNAQFPIPNSPHHETRILSNTGTGRNIYIKSQNDNST
ncbi:MAG: hypothetical protein V7K98_14210 [Nostoc sp.]|uniref:hypothetical protein n=1 Tax=Nostoc sp. TaxID=1180 RepID=UPI002FFD25B4